MQLCPTMMELSRFHSAKYGFKFYIGICQTIICFDRLNYMDCLDMMYIWFDCTLHIFSANLVSCLESWSAPWRREHTRNTRYHMPSLAFSQEDSWQACVSLPKHKLS